MNSTKRHDTMRLLVASLFAAAVLWAAPTGSAWAQCFPLSGSPVWGSQETGGSQSIAWGDVDGDGDLDLACTFSLKTNALFLNHDGMLESTPSWYSHDEGWIMPRSVAWGDVDGDGHLDLAVGCSGLGDDNYFNRIYFNTGQGLATSPGWYSRDPNETYCVAWADVDGDGDLDLGCGNNGPNKLYLNTGGVLATAPAWSSADTTITYSIAWGDVDGDGDLDLACGNHHQNTLYLNEGGTLTSLPLSFGSDVATSSVAWGDFDGDGDLDLACGNSEVNFGAHNTLYENVGGMLSEPPVWVSNNSYHTEEVAWADVDGDGDLDLACANEGEVNTLYLNDGGALQLDPVWESTASGRSLAVAWGDMDGDGDLDLGFGLFGEGNAVYLNTSSPFDRVPQDILNVTPVSSLAFGDVDGDGDLDLVCGNSGQTDMLYLNWAEGIWLPSPFAPSIQDATQSVAWGDVDGDGDLDLVCGNGSEQRPEANTLFENVGGTLSSGPVWTSVPAQATNSVALADIDRDGDLDLACGNDASLTLYGNTDGDLVTSPTWEFASNWVINSIAWGDYDADGDPDLACGVEGKNFLFVNQDGTLSPTPIIWSEDPATTYSVVWGDIDGDGYLDLICGNYGINTIYFNDNGVLSDTPGWTSVNTEITNGIAVGDVDGDGDLDLVCSNKTQNTVYLNDKGVLSTTANWLSEASTTTQAAVLGDVDGDGDLDVAFGNAFSNTVIHHGQGYPVFGGDPLATTNHLPNNSTQLRNVRVAEVGTNLFEVAFTAVDPESDAFFIAPQYQIEGDFTWHDAEVDGSLPLGPFGSSPAGTASSFQWKIQRILPGQADYILRLRVVETVGRTGPIRHAASYLENVGRPEPLRPLLASTALRIPAVSVGDTVTVPLVLASIGTEPLEVSEIEPLASGLKMLNPPPLEIAPAGRDTVLIEYSPIERQNVSGVLVVDSNDVIEPQREMAIFAEESIPLEYEWTLLNAEADLPLGEAVTILLRPLPNVHIERGAVWYRRAGSEGPFEASRFDPIGGEFVALIPGEDVTESGLEYYLEVENSGIFAADPAGAPDAGVHFNAVVAPAGIQTNSLPNVDGDYQEAQAIVIQARLPQGSEFEQGMLRYRPGGDRDYSTVPLEGDSLLLRGTIPADDVGCRGLEYYVEVQTTNSVLTDPATEPSSNPRSVPVHVIDLGEPDTHRARTYRMASMPLTFSAGEYRDWVDLLAGDPVFGPYDPVHWRSFRYDPTAKAYRELNPDGEDEMFRLVPGKAFWLICSQDHRVSIGPADGHSTATDEPYRITLSRGWNQIGNPFCFPVAWDSVSVGGMVPVTADTLIGGPVDASFRSDVSVLEPFEGYWVLNRHDVEVSLRVPPRVTEPDKERRPSDKLDWAIDISAATAQAMDLWNTLGVGAGAGDGFDRYDRAEVPMPPGDAISLYFPHGEWPRFGGSYAVDVRSADSQSGEFRGYAFRFDVAKNFDNEDGGQVTLRFSGLESVPVDLNVVLVDRLLERSQNLREASSYVFSLGTRDLVLFQNDARFEVLVGSDDFVRGGLPDLPAKTALHQNYPNPFNPSTMIRFDLSVPCRAALRIYNINGVLIRTLYDNHAGPGGYELLWSGLDDDGRRMASGLYFARLTTDKGYVETRKLVLVK